MVAAGETTHITTVHRALDLAAQQHRRNQADLINVVALLPAPNPSPRDLRRRGEKIESVRGDATVTELVGSDSEVSQFQLLVLADKNVERREITMHRLPQVKHIESSEECGDLATDEPFGLCTLVREPDAEVTMHRVLHCDAIARTPIIDLGESVEHAQCSRLAEKELCEIRLADPCRKTLGDLDADLRRQPVLGSGCREIDFAESSFTDQSVKLVGSSALGAVDSQ